MKGRAAAWDQIWNQASLLLSHLQTLILLSSNILLERQQQPPPSYKKNIVGLIFQDKTMPYSENWGLLYVSTHLDLTYTQEIWICECLKGEKGLKF